MSKSNTRGLRWGACCEGVVEEGIWKVVPESVGLIVLGPET